MKVIKNYFYTASYQLLSIIIPMITAPYISRTLGPNGAGINAFTYSLISYFLLVANLGINYYGNREIAYVRDDVEKTTKVFWEIQLLRFLTVIFSIFLFLIFIHFYHKYSYFLLLQSINLIAVFFDISWLYMGIENFKYLLMRNAIIKILSLVLIFSFIRNSSDLDIYIIIIGLSTLLGNITLWPNLRVILHHSSIRLLNLKPLRHLRPMVGLFIPTIASQLYIELNKTMLGIMVSTDASGFYTYSDNIIKMLLTLITSVGTVMLPHVSNAYANGEKTKINNMLYNSFSITSFVSIPLCFGLFMIAPEFSVLFYGKEYSEVGYAMQWESPLIIFITWSTIIGLQYLIPQKRERWFSNSALIGALTNVILNIPFIILFKLKGAMISTVISEFMVSAYQLYKIKGLIDLKLLFRDIYKYILASCLIVLVGFVNVFKFSLIFSIFIKVVCGIGIYFIAIYFLKPSILTLILKLKRNDENL